MRTWCAVAASALVVLTPARSGLAKQAHTAKQVHVSTKQKAGLQHGARASRKPSHHAAQVTKKCSVGAAHTFSGMASVYAAEGKSDDGIARELTAAHCTLPFGTRVQVTNAASGRTVIVIIRDRGPFVRGRVLDLSPAAAQAIGLTTGVLRIKAQVMQDSLMREFPFWELRPPEKPAT